VLLFAHGIINHIVLQIEPNKLLIGVACQKILPTGLRVRITLTIPQDLRSMVYSQKIGYNFGEPAGISGVHRIVEGEGQAQQVRSRRPQVLKTSMPGLARQLRPRYLAVKKQGPEIFFETCAVVIA